MSVTYFLGKTSAGDCWKGMPRDSSHTHTHTQIDIIIIIIIIIMFA